MKLNHLLFLFLLFLVSCLDPKNPESEILSYHIRPVLRSQQAFIEVSFEQETNANGEIVLRYENEFWGEDSLFKNLGQIVTAPAAQIKIQADSSQIRIQSKPGQKLKITYQIIQDKPGPIVYAHTYRPIVQSDYFHLFGHRLLIFPRGYFQQGRNKKKAMELNWILSSNDFKIHNSFGNQRQQLLYLSKDQIYSSIFMGGDLESFKSEIEGNDVYLVSKKPWKNLDLEEAHKALERMIRFQRDFWQDHRDSLYSVTLIPTYEPWTETSKRSSMGGTGLSNSFASFVSDNPGTDTERLIWLFSHELLHHWIGKKINNANEEAQYWFSEGFTDYYSYKLMLRSGEIATQKFLDLLNEEVLKPHYSSPVRSKPNSAITREKFWSDRNYEKLPYRRGLIYAFFLDTKIKQKYSDKSLDDLMRALLLTSEKEGKKLNAEMFLSHLDRFALADSQSAFQTYIEKGQPINLRKLKIKGLEIKGVDIPRLEMQANSVLEEVSAFLTR